MRSFIALFGAAFENRKKAAALVVLMLLVLGGQAQTSQIVDNGSISPACPGVGTGELRLKATCDTGPIQVTINDESGNPVYTGTSGDIIQGGLPGGRYSARLSCNSADKGTFIFQLGSPAPTIVVGQQGSAGSVSTVCNSDGLTLTLTGTTPSAGTTVLWSGPGTIANTAASSTTVTNIPSGADRVYKYIWKKSGCTDRETTSSPITIVAPPVLNPVADVITCDGSDTSPIHFTEKNNMTDVTYSWSNGKPSIGLAGSGTGDIPSFTASNTTGILITAPIIVQGSVNGCSGPQVNFNIKVYPRLTASLSSDKVSYCSGEDIVLTLTTNISGTYTWTGPNSFSNTTIENNKVVTVSPSQVVSSGTYNVRASVGQCSQSASTAVSVTQGPGLVINNPAACSGQTVDLTAPAVTQGTTGAGLSFSYWFDAGATAQIPNPRQITSNGTYYIKANDGSCPVTKPVTVTFGAQPQIIVTNPAPVCEGDATGYPVDLSKTFTPASGITYTYWKDQAATTQIQSNPPTIYTLGTTTYYIKGTRTGGCATVAPVAVKINARPVMSLRNPAIVCNPPASGTAQVEICAPAVTAGTTPVDNVSSTSNPYSYWTDAACTQSAGTPLYNSPSNSYSLKLPNPYPPPTDVQKYEYIYYIKAKKSYPGDGNAAVCTSVGQVTVTVAPKPVITLQNLDNSLKTSLCDTERRNLMDFPSSSIVNTTFQFYFNAAMTSTVSPSTSVGAGTYYVKGTTPDGCSSTANQPITIRQFAKPSIVTQDAGVCYVSNTAPYSLTPLVTSFAGDAGSLRYSTVRDSYADDYPAGNISLPATPTPTEYSTGIIQKVIWVQGYKTYTYNYNTTIVNQTRKCYSNSDGRRFTVKPLPRISLPSARHDLLCSGGKTNIVPKDDNALRYPNLGSPYTRTAAYYWTAQETDRAGTTPTGQDIVSGEADQPSNPTPSATKIQQILTLTGGTTNPFGYVRYTITAMMNGCSSQNTFTMDVPIVNSPAPVVNDNQFHMCGGTAYKLDGAVDDTDYSNTTPPVNRPALNKAPVPLATRNGDSGVLFNWTSEAIANAAGHSATGKSEYTTKSANDPSHTSSTTSPGSTANFATAGFIGDVLSNTWADDVVVEYSVLPYLAVTDDQGATSYCLGTWGTATVIVHPVPTLRTSATRLKVCDNSGVNIDLNSDKTTTLYYWNHSPDNPNQLEGVEDYQPTLSAPNNVPQSGAVFKSQMLDNRTNANYNVDFNITPNTGYSNSFGGCNGQTETVYMTVLNHHAPVFSAPPAPLEVCANVSGAVSNNVSIPLNSTVSTDTGPLSPLTGSIAYTWDIGGDYISRNYGPNGEDWKYFGDAFAVNTAPASEPVSLTANLILQGGNESDLALRQTTDRRIYYTVTPSYDGCAGSAVRVDLTVHPDPFITELGKVGMEQVCNGQEVLFNAKSHYPGDKMNYTWHVLTRQEQLNQGKTQTNPFYPVSSTGNPGSVDGPLQAAPVGGRFYFKDNVPVDVEVEFRAYNINTHCYGPKKPVVVTVQPKPTAQAVGAPAEICLSGETILNLSSPAQIVADPPLSVAGTKFKWDPVEYDPVLSVSSSTYDYAAVSLDNRVTDAGPIIDRWELADDNTTLAAPSRVKYMILPFLDACQGDTVYTEVTVYPIPNAIAAQLNPNGACSGTEVEVRLGTNPEVQGVKYKWEAVFDINLIRGMSSRSDPSESPIVQTITTTSTSQTESTYKIIPTLAYDPNSSRVGECAGSILNVKVLTNPLPSLTVAEADPPAICSGSSGQIILNHNLEPPTGVKYQWEVAGGADVTGYVSPSGDLDGRDNDYGALTNSAATEQSVFYIARATAIYQPEPASAAVECLGSSRNIKVKVAPQPQMKQPVAPPKFCSNDNVYIALDDDNRPGTFFTWTAEVTSTTNPDGTVTSDISGLGAASYTKTGLNEEKIGAIEGNIHLQGDESVSKTVVYTITPHIRIRPDGEEGEGTVCSAPEPHKTVTVNVGAIPVLNAILPTAVCSGADNVQINFSTTPGDATVSWSNDNVNTGLALSGTSSITPFKAALNESDRDFVSNIWVTPTSPEQCTGTSQKTTLTVRRAPIVGAAAENNYVCSAAPKITLSNPNNMQGTTYQWRVTAANVTNADGTPVASQEDTNPATAPTKFTSPALIPVTIQPGTVVYSFRALGANGCVGRPLEPPITITVNPVPQGETSPPDMQDVCSGDKTFITLQGRQGVPGGSIPAKYTWRVGNVDNAKGFTEVSTERTTSQISENVTVVDPLKDGSFVYYITPHAFGCTGDEFSIKVKLTPGLRPLKTNPLNTSFCIGNTVTLTSEPVDADVVYQWYSSNDDRATWGQVQNEAPYSGANTQNLTITNIPAKFHNRLFKVEISGKVCPNLKLSSTTAQLTEWLAGAAIETSGTTLLVGESVKYTYSGPTEGTTYAWDFGDGWNSKSQSPVHYYYTRGTYQTHLGVTKQNCTKDLYINPVLVKGPDYLGEIVTNDTPLNKGVLTYPVPFGDQLVIESPEVISKVIISNVQGAAVMWEEVSGKKATLSTGALAAGVYVVTVKHESGATRVKVVKY